MCGTESALKHVPSNIGLYSVSQVEGDRGCDVWCREYLKACAQ